MDEEKTLDEKALEGVTGGATDKEDISAAKSFRGPFIDANCSRCSRRGTPCTYPNDDLVETLSMYYVFKDLPGCPWIVVK